jgi:hypothetical protein
LHSLSFLIIIILLLTLEIKSKKQNRKNKQKITPSEDPLPLPCQDQHRKIQSLEHYKKLSEQQILLKLAVTLLRIWIMLEKKKKNLNCTYLIHVFYANVIDKKKKKKRRRVKSNMEYVVF